MAEEIATNNTPEINGSAMPKQSEAKRILESIKASTFKPVYEPLDLGEIAPEFSGQTLQVLRNPSRLFRRTFIDLTISSDDFVEWVGYIFDMSKEQAVEWLDTIDQSLHVFMFVPLFIAATETTQARWQQRALVEIWDTYAVDRAKKYHAR